MPSSCRLVALGALGALGALAVLLPAGAHTQAVRGRAVDSSGAPLPSAVVALVDTAGRSTEGALTGDDGGFTLRAPAPGTWRVRAERVGHRAAVSAPLTLAAGDTLRIALTLAPALPLAAVRVDARGRCQVRPEEGSRAAELWDGVRQALEGAALAMDTRRVPFSLERIERTRGADGRTLMGELRTVDPTGARLFESADPAALQRLGWVRASPDTVGMVEFHGPDAHTLVSEPFVSAHCLRVVAAPPERGAQIGLAFEPVPRGRDAVPDIRGTLWVDGGTGELRELEFAYVNLAATLQRHEPGGRVVFGRLPTGTWYVDAWQLRMPAYERIIDRTQWSQVAYLFTGTREVGGRTLLEGDLPEVPPDVARIVGLVVDSTEGHFPVIGARVEAEGTGYAAITDVYGTFRLELPARDSVRLRVTHPRVAALGIPVRVTVPVAYGRESSVPVGLPSVATVRRALCGGEADKSEALVTGALSGVRERPGRIAFDVDPSLPPMRGYEVLFTWPKRGGTAWDALTAMETRRVRTDAEGHFHACGIPANTRVRVLAMFQWWIDTQPFGTSVLELGSTPIPMRADPPVRRAPRPLVAGPSGGR
jgi:hypothetical protein